MLPEIEGATVPSSVLGRMSYERVLQYYDGPRLVLQRNQSGQLYLVWWNDSDDSTERWIWLPLSELRLRSILAGQTTALDGLIAAEDGYLFVVDKALEADSITQIVVCDSSMLDGDTLPHPGVRLNIPVPSEIGMFPLDEDANLLNVRIDNSQRRIDAKNIGEIFSNLQGLMNAIGNAIDNNPARRGAFSNTVLAQTTLYPVAIYASSFGVIFEAGKQDESLGESIATDALESLFDLVNAEDRQAELLRQLYKQNPRVTKNYKDFLSTIRHTVSLSWEGSKEVNGRQARITRQLAGRILVRVKAEESAAQKDLAIRGRLMTGSIRTRRFEIQSGLERYAGKVQPNAVAQLGDIRLGSQCEALLRPYLQTKQMTNESKVQYTLLRIAALES